MGEFKWGYQLKLRESSSTEGQLGCSDVCCCYLAEMESEGVLQNPKVNYVQYLSYSSDILY